MLLITKNCRNQLTSTIGHAESIFHGERLLSYRKIIDSNEIAQIFITLSKMLAMIYLKISNLILAHYHLLIPL